MSKVFKSWRYPFVLKANNDWWAVGREDSRSRRQEPGHSVKANLRKSPAPSGNVLSVAVAVKGGKVPCVRGIY